MYCFHRVAINEQRNFMSRDTDKTNDLQFAGRYVFLSM